MLRTPPWRTVRATPRSRFLRIIPILACVVGAYHFVQACIVYREALQVKYQPTTFPYLSADEQVSLEAKSWQWSGDPIFRPRATSEAQFRQELMDNRDAWTSLGSGLEGETFTYHGQVVKKFRRDQSPFRNCVPGLLPEVRWPTEISASLLLGGTAEEGATLPEDAGFLPVVDYFLAPEPEQEEQSWHLVTPLLPEGNLKGLAKRLRESETSYTATDLDNLFRPSLHHLLGALRRMHEEYQLCHDDVKLDNIFLASANGSSEPSPEPLEITHWLLGDLGNVRQRKHQYHESLLWTTHGNLEDCRANDVFRLMKVYMEFLSRAVDDVAVFDQEFFDASLPWSRLFWSIHQWVKESASIAATDVRDLSIHQHFPGSVATERVDHQQPMTSNSLHKLFVSSSWTTGSARQDVLSVWNGDRAARFWGLVPLLGIPSSSCWGD